MTAPGGGFSGIVNVWALMMGGLAALDESGSNQAIDPASHSRLLHLVLVFRTAEFQAGSGVPRDGGHSSLQLESI
jgi:hypothetical protein